MKELIILAVLFICLTVVPFETFSLTSFLLAVLETLVLLCLKYRKWKFLLCFFALSLCFKWGFDYYIEFFYQYIFPHFNTFGFLYKSFFLLYILLFGGVAVCGEVLLFKKMIGYNKGLWPLLAVMNVCSFLVVLFFGPLQTLMN